MPIDPPDIAGHPLVRQVAGALRHRCGVRPGAGVLAAVSGGADSVALLRALHALAPRRRWMLSLTVGHVQHHLRPADAEADAAFVADLAQQLDLPHHRRDIDPAAEPGNVEQRARALRYAGLADIATNAGAQVIITGHQADDQLETMLMRLLRGSSVRGLAGMAWRRRLPATIDPLRRPVLRPMLAVTHAQAVAFLRDIGQPWREDLTNADITRWRAALRHQVLPALAAIRADAPHKAVALGEHLRQVRKLIDDQAREAAGAVVRRPGRWTLDRHAARRHNPVVLTALVRRLLIEAGVGRDALRGRTLRPIVAAIRDSTGGQRTFHLPAQVRAQVTRDTVTFTR